MTHEVHIPVSGLTHPIKPAGVVIIDGETGEALPASALFGVTLADLLGAVLTVSPTVPDSTGQPFPLDACAHLYVRNSSGLPLTDTATYGASTWVKTYSYDASGNLVSKTGWVKQ